MRRSMSHKKRQPNLESKGHEFSQYLLTPSQDHLNISKNAGDAHRKRD